MKHLGLALIIVGNLSAGADQITETFLTRAHLELASPFAPTAVWNQGRGVMHSTLQVAGYGTGGEPVLHFDIGDGSDGAFNASTYARFGTVVANKLFYDTNAHPQIQVTSFYLEPGWILEPIGTAPLLIKSQSMVKIEGEIWCHGYNGQDATGATRGLGGLARCGGSRGGNGGAAANSGDNGFPGTDGVTPGLAGTYGTGAAGGGGGGGGRNCGGDPTCSSFLPGNGSNATTGGAHGSPLYDPLFTTLGGGAGGGGGSSGPLGEPGGGGGGGGGAVRIFTGGDFAIGAPSGLADGYIFARGGRGGNGNVAGGPGGGGGGGSVQVFAAGTISFNNAAFVSGGSQAGFGAGGTNTSADYGGDGGEGRSWFTSIDYQSPHASFYAPGEELPVTPGNFASYSTASQSVTTKVFDLQSSFPTLQSVSLSPSSTDYTVEYRASRDGFLADDSGWTANLSMVQNKRYLRLKISVRTSAPLAPVLLDSVTVNYTPGVLNDFQFKAAGCGRVAPPSDQSPAGFFLGLVILALTLAYLKLKARKQKSLTE